jgi:hypothetical protein
MLLFIAIAAIFLLVAVTRPGPNRLHLGRGRPRRLPGRVDRPVGAPDPTLGLRDPARRL